ncbi:MAG: UDP-glucose/GDP-mannose dehydrogenase family protein, partial [Proteobacteria bacterium]|nr:UDP-glucose/GDP-mannose dehydrogenase family protein [Pseudomonadota bacterium]
MRLCVLGTGYVGLVAGACFSDSGNHVICVDVDQEKVKRLEAGEIPIFEPGLEELVERNTQAKRLQFTTDSTSAISKAEVVFIAVGTPSGKDGALDLKYVLEAAKTVKEKATKDLLLVLKSTVPVGTAAKVRELLIGSTVNIEVVSNPEFMREGFALQDFLNPSRIIIGCENSSENSLSRQVMHDIYLPWILQKHQVLFTDLKTAELIKYASNAFLMTKVAFINEIDALCEKLGANVLDVAKGMGL